MKILVTGANGYLGQGIVKTLVENGQQVVATDFSTQFVCDGAQKVDCDLFALEDPYAYFGEPEVVLHLAWKDGFVHNSPAHMENLATHCNFLKKFVDSGVKRLAVMGTMHEIGFWEGSIDENVPCNPMSCYGIAKNALRQYAQWLTASNGVVLQWLRGYYIVGNSAFGNSIFSKITAAAKEGKKEFPFTRGLNQYDFLDYEDFCHQVAAAVAQDQVNGVINICTGRPEKLSDRVERFIAENGYDIKLQYGAFPDREYDSKAVWGSSAKMEKILSNTAIVKVKI